jgi:hypothetical protein
MPGDLLVAWTFDEASGPVLDHSGNSRDLTLNGTAARSSGKLIQTSAGTVTTGPDVTAFETSVRTWMLKLTVTGAANCWAMEFYRTANDTGVMGLLLLSGNLHFRIKNPSNSVFSSATIPQDTGNEHHIAATYDETGTLRVYRDGVLLGSPVPVTGGIWDADVLRVLDNAGGVFRIDDVRLFNGALTQEEIDAWRVLPADQFPDTGGPETPGRLKYESSPGVWTPVPIKTETGAPVTVKSETSPGTWEALP